MSAYTLRPVGPHIIVRPDENPKETSGGIVLAETWAKPPTTAVIVAIGLPRTVLVSRQNEGAYGYRKVPVTDFHIGQRIFCRYIDATTRVIEWEGEKLKALRVDEILGCVE